MAVEPPAAQAALSDARSIEAEAEALALQSIPAESEAEEFALESAEEAARTALRLAAQAKAKAENVVPSWQLSRLGSEVATMEESFAGDAVERATALIQALDEREQRVRKQ